MSFIGPNFRPPAGQQSPATGARRSEGANPAQGQAPTGEAGQFSSPRAAGVEGTLSLAALLAGQNPLAPGQLAQLLRNLLSMPKEIVQFLALLSEHDPAAGQALLQTLMSEDVKIPLEAMQGFLEGRLDKAQEKLLKLVQGNPAALAGAGEMGELMKGLSELAAKNGQSPTEALHSTITLYLPFYPLHPPQAFTLRFEPPTGGDEEAGGEQEPQLVIYIETLTMGQFRAAILTGPQSCWQAVIEHDPQATEFVKEIEKGVQEAAPLEQPTLIFSARAGRAQARREEASPAASTQTGQENMGKQSVGLHPAGGVSVLAIHAAYLLIRVILEMDNQNALHQGRASSV